MCVCVCVSSHYPSPSPMHVLDITKCLSTFWFEWQKPVSCYVNVHFPGFWQCWTSYSLSNIYIFFLGICGKCLKTEELDVKLKWIHTVDISLSLSLSFLYTHTHVCAHTLSCMFLCVSMFLCLNIEIYNFMKLYSQCVHPHNTNKWFTDLRVNKEYILHWLLSASPHLTSLPTCPAVGEWPPWTVSCWLLCPLASGSMVGTVGD